MSSLERTKTEYNKLIEILASFDHDVASAFVWGDTDNTIENAKEKIDCYQIFLDRLEQNKPIGAGPYVIKRRSIFTDVLKKGLELAELELAELELAGTGLYVAFRKRGPMERTDNNLNGKKTDWLL